MAGAEVRLLGTVHGLVAETARVEAAFREGPWDAVGLGVAPAELEALEAHVAGAPSEEGDEEELTLDPSEAYATGLARFGDIALPPPDLLATVALAREAGIEPAPLDLDATQYDDVFTANVGAFALFRYGRRVRRMGKRPPPGATPEEYARAWDARIRALKGFDAVEKARERHMALRVETIADGKRRVLVVVDVARAPGLRAVLAERNP